MKHNPAYDKTEYSMLRTEILQYLEEYQTIRNMMYIATGTFLGLGIGTGISFLYLVPLVVIIPSYVAHLGYNKCVNKAGTYLQCYWENRDGFPMQWETRSSKYGEKINHVGRSSGKSSYKRRMYLPYYLCAMACFLLYFSSLVIGIWEDLMERTSAFVLAQLIESGVIESGQALPAYYPIRISDVLDVVRRLDFTDTNVIAWLVFTLFQFGIGIALMVYSRSKMKEDVPELRGEECVKIWMEIKEEELDEKGNERHEETGCPNTEQNE